MDKKHLTTFPKLRTVFIHPQEFKPSASGPPNPWRNGHAIEQALEHSTKTMRVLRADSRIDAIRRAEVVIAVGDVPHSTGKQTLKLVGEVGAQKHSDDVRRFLRKTGATSVAIALAPGQAFWRVYRLFRHSFDWSRKDFCVLTHEDKQEARKLWATGDWTQRQLADHFGVSQPAITYIVTGYADEELFKRVRKEGYVTLNWLATIENMYYFDVENVVEELNVNIHRVGPLYNMVNRYDARIVRKALRRLRTERKREKARLKRECKRGHPWSKHAGIKKNGKGGTTRFCKACAKMRQNPNWRKNAANQ